MSDPTGGGNVGIHIDVGATGLDQAGAARRAIEGLGTAGTATSGRLAQLGSAFERLEQREPSMALRQTRFAVESLALSAVGAEGPMGRLLATFGLLTAGTGVGLAVLGFTAAAAAGFRLLTADISATSEAVDAGEKKLAALSAPTPLAQHRLDLIQGRGAIQQLEQMGPLATTLRESSFLEKLSAFLPGGGIGFSTDPKRFGVTLGEQSGAVAEAAETRRQAELTGERQQRRVAEAAAAKELAQLEAERAKLLGEETLALDKARLGTHATNAQLEAFAERADRLKLSTTNLSPAEKERIEHLEVEGRALTTLNRAAAITAAQRGAEVAGIARRTEAEPGGGPPERVGFRPGQHVAPVDPRISTVTGERLPGVLQGAAVREPGYGEHVAHGGMGPPALKDNTDALRTLAVAIPELAGSFARAARGDGGAALTGLGGAAGTLSRVHGLQALGPVGDVLSGIGGLVSLFGGGQAKVTIARIEDEALAKLKDVLQIPQNVSAVIVSASSDARQTKYDLDRLAAKTGVTTLPGRS